MTDNGLRLLQDLRRSPLHPPASHGHTATRTAAEHLSKVSEPPRNLTHEAEPTPGPPIYTGIRTLPDCRAG